MLGKQIKKKVEVEVKIGECDSCHFRGIDGVPGQVMVCEHPDAPDSGYIISWANAFNPNSDCKRISDKCPLEDK